MTIPESSDTKSLPVASSLYTSDPYESTPMAVAVGYSSNNDETSKLNDTRYNKNDQHDAFHKNTLGYSKDNGLEEGGDTQYWGRFNDPMADSTVLPSGAAIDNTMPIATAELDNRMVRHLFIRKVYLILIGQLLVTFATSAVMTLHEPTRDYVLGAGVPLLFVFSVLMFVLVCALSCFKRSYPTNIILLSLFTLSCSYLIGSVSAVYAQQGDGDLVLEAILITALVFIILTCYTLQSKKDFSFLQAGLGAGLWIMVLWGFAAMIFGLHTGWFYALAGSVLFSGYIIFDTFMLAEKHDPQDYVIAAVELYLDIINLFLYILRLLSSDD